MYQKRELLVGKAGNKNVKNLKVVQCGQIRECRRRVPRVGKYEARGVECSKQCYLRFTLKVMGNN